MKKKNSDNHNKSSTREEKNESNLKKIQNLKKNQNNICQRASTANRREIATTPSQEDIALTLDLKLGIFFLSLLLLGIMMGPLPPPFF